MRECLQLRQMVRVRLRILGISARRRAGGLLLAILFVAAACTPAPIPPVQPTAPTADAWTAIEQTWTKDGHTKQAALDAFATLVAPIPGGNAKHGEVPRNVSGTVALASLLGHYRELDSDQRKAAREAVLGGEAVSLTLSPQRPTGSSRLASWRSEVGASLPSKVTLNDFRRVLRNVVGKFKTWFPNLPIPDDPVIVVSTTEYAAAHFSTAPATYKNGPLDFVTTGPVDVCAIGIQKKGISLAEEVQAGLTPTWVLESALAHELIHCSQFLAGDDVAVWLDDNRRPRWLTEGSANWGGAKYAYELTQTPANQSLPVLADGKPLFGPYWDKYLGKDEDDTNAPPKPLFTRSYDGLGFFAHIENSGADPWSTMFRMYQAVIHSGEIDSAAFLQANQSANFATRWAMGMVRQQQLGPDWETSGPGISEYVPRLETRNVADTQISLSVAAGATDRQEVTFKDRNKKILVLDTFASHVGLYWKGGTSGAQEVIPSSFPPTVRAYCLDPGGCSCPKGQTYSGEYKLISPPVPVVESLLIAFTGGAKPGNVAVEVKPLPCQPETSCSSSLLPRVQSTGAGAPQAIAPAPCSPPTCSVEAQQKVKSIIGEDVEAGRAFSSEGTTGCLWLQTAPVDPDDDFKGGPNGDYVVLGRRAPGPNVDTAQAFKSFASSRGATFCNQGEAESSITCTGVSEGVALAERWFGPGDVLAVQLRVQLRSDPVSLALRVLDEVPR